LITPTPRRRGNGWTALHSGKVNKRIDGTPLHLYLPGQYRDVWTEQALENSKEIILCESLIERCSWDAY
jgi:hypothetical protein